MKKLSWQKYLSLVLSFVIVFNLTMIPVFAEGETVGEAPAQEETGEQAVEEEAEEPAEEEAGTEAEEEPAADEQEEQPSEEQTADEEEPVEAPSEGEPEEHVGGEGKYVKEVYIAYAKTEDEAKAWLRKHKWEPLNGNADFNAGKASKFDDDVAAVMGIRRTDKKEEAVTDMAVMNMKGGYSFPDYESLLKEKKADIKEYIDSFIPVLKEYRANYNGEGSDAGNKRAKVAHDILNKFYDGDKDDPYAANDTGKPLGDLLLEKIKQEGNERGADMEQILLECSKPALTTIQVCLALASDSGKDTWLERLQGLSGDDLEENLEKYVPEAKGQDVAPSAVNKFLKQHFGRYARMLASEWGSIHRKMLWYERYNEKHDLWKHDKEKVRDHENRLSDFFKKLDKGAPNGIHEDHERYVREATLYDNLYEIKYEGEWGETLGDFFNPAEGEGYEDDTNSFLPVAAALSEGQKSAIEQVSLETLLTLGMGTEDSIEALIPQVQEVFKSADSISIYSGINRGIYRGGVALTSAALMEKNQNGYDPFADMWSFSGIYNITSYAVAAVGLATLGVGLGYYMYIRNSSAYQQAANMIDRYKNAIAAVKNNTGAANTMEAAGLDMSKELRSNQHSLSNWEYEANELTKSARVIMGIGGALIVAAAMAKGYQLYRYYNKTFTQIPNYIVDEADIVSYEKDDEGAETRLVQFDQFVYYQVVKCNRQEVGEISDWQDGVSDYAGWGCGDAADLNGDFGQQWLALYTVKSAKKGHPILADSLTLQYGSNKIPEGVTRALHMFTYENAVDLGDTAYSFNNDKKGVYFFWDVDEKAYETTASTFAGGSTAIAGGLGLLIGIIGTAIVMNARKKKED